MSDQLACVPYDVFAAAIVTYADVMTGNIRQVKSSSTCHEDALLHKCTCTTSDRDEVDSAFELMQKPWHVSVGSWKKAYSC